MWAELLPASFAPRPPGAWRHACADDALSAVEEALAEDVRTVLRQDPCIPRDIAADLVRSMETSPHGAGAVSRVLPPAEELARLESMAPGATERLLRLTEHQQHARQELALLEAVERRRAQYFAFVFALAALAASVVLAWLGYPTPAAVVGGTTVCGVVATFLVSGRKGNRDTGDSP
jgi:uncharacterized membrane protein